MVVERLPSVHGHGRTDELGGHAALTAAYIALTAIGVGTAARRHGWPRDGRASDLALLSVASFRLSRLITKDKVTNWVRAPFTRFVEDGDAGEVNEAPRGNGLSRAIGELLTCPFCFTQWSATALGVAWLHAPRATRSGEALLTAASVADLLHVVWVKIESQA